MKGRVMAKAKRATAKETSQSAGKTSKRRIRRPSLWKTWGPIGAVLLVVVLVVGIFFLMARQQATASAGTGGKTEMASSRVIDELTHVDPKVLAEVGNGGVQNTPHALRQSLLTEADGKPEIFFASAEYCPYCAAQRWAIVVALSHFGTFHQLGQTTSSGTDVDPSTPTLTFHGSSYSSTLLDFEPVELQTNQQDSSGNYTALETPTAQQQQLLATYDAPPYVRADSQGSIPFMDIANQFVMAGSGYDPQLLSGQSWEQIAATLSDPNSPITRGIVGTANTLTAAICMTTNQQPANVCTAAPISHLQQPLTGSAIPLPGSQNEVVADTINVQRRQARD
jgi:hypothetical protein